MCLVKFLNFLCVVCSVFIYQQSVLLVVDSVHYSPHCNFRTNDNVISDILIEHRVDTKSDCLLLNQFLRAWISRNTEKFILNCLERDNNQKFQKCSIEIDCGNQWLSFIRLLFCNEHPSLLVLLLKGPSTSTIPVSFSSENRDSSTFMTRDWMCSDFELCEDWIEHESDLVLIDFKSMSVYWLGLEFFNRSQPRIILRRVISLNPGYFKRNSTRTSQNRIGSSSLEFLMIKSTKSSKSDFW